MTKPAARTTLYRLIEAGHLARQRMLVPLYERGLEAGDDALLFALDAPDGVSEAALREVTGLNEVALEMRLVRLEEAGILAREGTTVRLTQSGGEVAVILDAQWQQLEEALTGELSHKHHKKLRKILKRFVALLGLH